MEIWPTALDWAGNIIRYLETNKVPEGRQEVRKIRNRVARYSMIEGVLYRQGHSMPLLRCISSKEAQYVLAKTHKRICENHSGGQALVGKVMRASYYWP